MRNALSFATAAILTITSHAAAATIIYVDASATGANDGSSWTSAFSDLQEALAHAATLPPGEEIQLWIAAGTYKPGTPDDGPDATFNLVSGVALYGGFAGGEESLDERDWVENETILSGLLSDTGSDATRSHHVLTGSGLAEGARLDGLSIRDGRIWGVTYSNDKGAGLLVSDSTLHIENAFFIANHAYLGGGAIHATESQLIIVNSRFLENSVYEEGGAVRALGGTLTLKDCEFIGNSAYERAGALRTSGVLLVVEDTLFESNKASWDLGSRGAALLHNDSTLINCTFHQNTAYGIGHLTASDSLTLIGCTFTGGADYEAITGGGFLTMIDTIVSGNKGGLAWWNGPTDMSTIVDSLLSSNAGGLWMSGGAVTIRDSVFSGNVADVNGGNIVLSSIDATLINTRSIGGGDTDYNHGGIRLLNNSTLNAVNCLIRGNVGGVEVAGTSHATFINSMIINNILDDPPGVFIEPGSHAVFNNSIVWGNTCFDYEECQIVGNATVSHSIIQSDEPWPGEGNLNVDPLFIDDDGRVSPDSPAIDAGDNDAFPPDIEPVDLDGNPRIVDGTGDGVAFIDIGAFEFQIPTIPGDLTGDGKVGVPDLLMLLQAWGECADCSNCPADLTGNCMVGVPDLLILLANWTG